jgi:methionine synthase I (cobalamin-dependent)
MCRASSEGEEVPAQTQTRNRFLERLEAGPAIVGDGGMGALLSAAVPRLRTPEEANLRAPDAVVSLHVSFINAGSELIETNTFGANRRKLGHHFLEDELENINSAGVKLARDAREVTGRDVFIAGSIGPLGESATSRVRRELFAEQAAVLDGRGADLFMVETFYDLEEVVDAIEAVRSASNLPIVALLTFDESAETLAGVTAAEAAERIRQLDVAAVGANHGAGLLAALAALEQMGKEGTPLAALPNVGLASLAGGRVIYPHATPEYFAEFAAHARDLGAMVIGGCCGTTPAEIAAIRAAVEEERKPRAPLVFESPELVVALGEEQRETGLSRAFAAGEWVVSVQLDPPLGGNSSGLVEVAAMLKDSGQVGWVDINDNATARAGMSSLMVSAAIERHAEIETIPHLTTRDWSVMGLESMLLGVHAEGVRNVLAVTGDPPEVGDYPGARGV